MPYVLNMKIACPTEISVKYYQTAWSHIPENSNIQMDVTSSVIRNVQNTALRCYGRNERMKEERLPKKTCCTGHHKWREATGGTYLYAKSTMEDENWENRLRYKLQSDKTSEAITSRRKRLLHLFCKVSFVVTECELISVSESPGCYKSVEGQVQ
jgi:hypothetical protein